ncbi:MAG: aspartate kinase [Abditibacteriota bacterium]|nr:aspartate kinase [Abditibacteriota bacterium]
MSLSPIVCKFGGTSLADAEQIRKVASIVRANERRRFVVVSAPGKRHKNDQKVTDLLLTCWHLAMQQLDYAQPLQMIRERYNEIARDLDVEPVAGPLEEMEHELRKLAADDQSTLATRDWIASRGEYFHACLVAAFLEATFVPAGECIRFDNEGALDSISYDLLQQHMQSNGLYVIPGFYGRDMRGRIKTFPRGGSDITGAVVARAVQAEVYENWTDVSGLLMADPRVVENPRPIGEVTYRELRELSYMGATVLHEETIFPASQAGIPIYIKNTNAPLEPGTRIVATRDASQPAIVGIAGKVGFTTIYLEKALMNQQRGYGRRVLEVLEAHGISYEHIPSGIDSMSIIVSDEQLGNCEPAVLRELKRTLEPDRIETYPDLALIATVGEGMAHRVGVSGCLFEALRQAQVNVRMISQGASEINIIVGVEASDYERAVRAIYDAFVE